jgi:methionine-rich copper-binding protein CopC
MGKRFWIIAIALTLVMPAFASAAANITVTLTSPEDAYSSTSSSVAFSCSATDSYGNEITSLKLLIDATGSMETNKTASGTGTSSLSLSETVNGIPNGNWKWNCEAENNASEVVRAGSDRTFSVAVPAPATTLNFTGPIQNVTFNEDSSISNAFDLDDYFQAAGTVSYSKSGNSHVNVEIATDGRVSFSASANWSGVENILFTATSGALSNTSNTVVVNVTAVNDAPMASYIPSQNWTMGTNKTITLSDYFSDVENDILVYNVTSMPANITIIISGAVATLVPDANWTGTRTVVFTANDSKATTSSNTITLNVSSNKTATTNRAPVFDTCPGSGTGRFYVKEKEVKVFTVAVSDPDSNPLTIKWFIDNAEISGQTGTSYSFSKDSAGTYVMKVTADDGNTSASCSWIVVVEKESTNSSNLPMNVNVSSIIQQQTEETARCGDGIIQSDKGEDCESCPADVKCGKNEECVNKVCMPKAISKIKIILILAIACAVIGGGSLAAYMLTSRRKVQRQLAEANPLKNVKKEVPAIDVHDVYAKISEMKNAGRQENIKIPQKPKESPLKKYVEQMRANGFNDAEIASRLKSKGWSDADIKSAL